MNTLSTFTFLLANAFWIVYGSQGFDKDVLGVNTRLILAETSNFSSTDISSTLKSVDGINYTTYSFGATPATYYRLRLHFSIPYNLQTTSAAMNLTFYINDAKVTETVFSTQLSGRPIVKQYFTSSGPSGSFEISQVRAKNSLILSSIEAILSEGLYPVDPSSGASLSWLHTLNCGESDLSVGPDEAERMWRPSTPYLQSVSDIATITLDIIPPPRTINGTEESPKFLPEEVYQTSQTIDFTQERKVNHSLSYLLPVETGKSYLLTLHFVEMLIDSVGGRIMNVFVDDVIQIKDLDIFKEAGFKSALAKTFMVKSTSEFLNVTIARADSSPFNNPVISGIEVLNLLEVDAEAASKIRETNPFFSVFDISGSSSNGGYGDRKWANLDSKSLWLGVAVGVSVFAVSLAFFFVVLACCGVGLSMNLRNKEGKKRNDGHIYNADTAVSV